MEIVLNDYSLNAQFKDAEAFADSLTEYTLPLLKILKEKGFFVLKRFQSYDLHITKETTLNDFINFKRFTGYTEFQKLRTLLIELRDEPYWETEPRTDLTATYKMDFLDVENVSVPNCFSEAYERDRILLSLEHASFQDACYEIEKNDVMACVHNFRDRQSSLHVLLEKGLISFSEFLGNLCDSVKVEFFCSGDNVYVDKEVAEWNLRYQDMIKIGEYFRRWIYGVKTGDMIAHLTDSIQHKKISYNEFRVTLDDRREFRMFYKVFGSRYVFFNTLLKDTAVTPDATKEKTCSLIKSYRSLQNCF